MGFSVVSQEFTGNLLPLGVGSEGDEKRRAPKMVDYGHEILVEQLHEAIPPMKVGGRTT